MFTALANHQGSVDLQEYSRKHFCLVQHLKPVIKSPLDTENLEKHYKMTAELKRQRRSQAEKWKREARSLQLRDAPKRSDPIIPDSSKT